MLDQRREQGAALIDQLDDALEELSVSKGRQKNIATEGLIDDTAHHLDEVADERLHDPLLLASVQKIEHYCIAAWGTAASMGRLLGQEKVVRTMEQVLTEGKEFDDQMTRLADEEVNPRMIENNEDREDEDEEDQGDGSSRGKRASRRKSQ